MTTVVTGWTELVTEAVAGGEPCSEVVSEDAEGDTADAL
jgi:hypothetical protein